MEIELSLVMFTYFLQWSSRPTVLLEVLQPPQEAHTLLGHRACNPAKHYMNECTAAVSQVREQDSESLFEGNPSHSHLEPPPLQNGGPAHYIPLDALLGPSGQN